VFWRPSTLTSSPALAAGAEAKGDPHFEEWWDALTSGLGDGALPLAA
jgi:hypothetical protein